MYKKISLAIMAAGMVVMSACNKESEGGFKTAEGGLEYNLISSNKEGIKAKIGDIVSLHMIYTNDKDSVLFDTYDRGSAIEMQLRESAFKGSLEDGLMMMSPGDSAMFLINADSLFAKTFNAPLPDFIAAGSKLKFRVKLISAKSMEQFTAEKENAAKENGEREDEMLKQYLAENNINATKTESGLYFIKTKTNAKGKKPETGQTLVVHYTGKLLDGTTFDSSVERNEPFETQIGVGMVIRGWDEGMMLFNTGEKGTLYIPSRLAYGERGAGGVIPPNAMLMFDIELIDVK
jgi:FKBP-type peptidyl-prolyl cis-trans isomerase FkpA